MKIFTVAHVPDALANAWLQHLRDFDTANPGCHFEVIAEGAGPKMTMKEMVEALRVEPELTVTEMFERGGR